MKNILVIRFTSLGDVVLTTGVLKYIKTEQPDINIDIITMTHFAGLFTEFPYVRNVYCINKNASLQDLLEVLNSMPEYDGVFDLHGNARSAFVKMILPVKNFTYEKNSIARRLFVKFRLFRYRLKDHVTKKYCRAISDGLGIPAPTNPERLKPWIANPFPNRKKTVKKTIGIHPFASKKGKEWPFVYDLAKLLIDEGHNVRVVGDGKMKLPPKVEDMTGFTPLNMLIRNIADCDIFLSTDSGPMHIATALGLPVVALFGPTTKELGFYPIFSGCTVIEDKNLKCRPCHIHGPDKCPLKHFRCMLSATIEEVRTKLLNPIS